MADRRCPYCGELVPSNSVTCPKCYKKIPVEPEPVRRERRTSEEGGGRTPSRKIALALAVIPGFFGLLGLGLIYRNPRQKRGYMALVLGLLVFLVAVCFTVFIMTIFLAVPFWIIYALLYLGCLAITFMEGVTFRVGGMGPLRRRYIPSRRSLAPIDAAICARSTA